MPIFSEMHAAEKVPLCTEDGAANEPIEEVVTSVRSKNRRVKAAFLVLTAVGLVGAVAWLGRRSGPSAVDLQGRISQEGLPNGGKCAQFGCGAPLNQASLCQCDGQCLFRGDCCEDFGLACPQVQLVPGPVEVAQGAIPGASLYCFALMVPGSYEEPMVKWQYQAQASIFSCEEYQVFSNVTLDLGGIQTYSIGGNLQTPYLDIYSLNTDVFIRLWNVAAYVGAYKNHDWSIKVDVDCVFFPDRFRTFVQRQDNQQIPGPLIPAGAVWLNNCQYGMHGPLEVISRDGMATFLTNLNSCENIRQTAMNPSIGYGEDQFARECWMQLQVPKLNEFETLLSERWNCIERPKDCSGKKIAFHAWKDIGSWANCWQTAQNSGQWPR